MSRKNNKNKSKIIIVFAVVSVTVFSLFGAFGYGAYKNNSFENTDSTTFAAGTCTVSDKLVNSCRPWIAAATSGYTMAGADTQSIQFSFFEKRMNDPDVLNNPTKSVTVTKQLDFIHVYKKDNQTLNTVEKSYANRANTYLQLNYKPITTVANAWRESDGRNATANSNIDGMANSIKSLAPKKVMLSIYHEPENDIISNPVSGCNVSGGSVGTPAEYVAMWHNVRARFDALGVTNVVWNMNYMGFDKYNCVVSQLWPGNAYVDWVTYDPYVGGPDATQYRSSTNMTKKFYDFLTTSSNATNDYLSKPWGFSEFGYWNQSGTSTESQAPIYWQTAKAAFLAGELPKIKLFSVFDTPSAESYEFASLVGLAFNNVVTPNVAEQTAYNDFAATVLSSGAEVVTTGDFTGDGLVNGADLSILLSNWNATNASIDLNNDGIVGPVDLSMLLSNWTR